MLLLGCISHECILVVYSFLCMFVSISCYEFIFMVNFFLHKLIL